MYIPDWPETHYVSQTNLEFTEISLLVLGLKVCATTPGSEVAL